MNRRARLGELPADLGLDAPARLDVTAAARARAVTPPPGAALPLPAFGGAADGVVRVDARPFTYPTVAGSKLFMQANAHRRYLLIQSLAASDLWVNFGANAAVNQGIKLTAGTIFEWFYAIPVGSVYVFGATAGLFFTIAQG